MFVMITSSQGNMVSKFSIYFWMRTINLGQLEKQKGKLQKNVSKLWQNCKKCPLTKNFAKSVHEQFSICK